MLFGVFTNTLREELDERYTKKRVAALTQPVGIGQCLKQSHELLVFSHDHCQEITDSLTAGKAGATIAFLIEVGEDGSIFIKESPDPKPVDVDDHVAQVSQRLQC